MADAIVPKAPIAISATLKVDDVKVLARSTERVPDTANRMDQRIGLLAVDFATHAPDIDVDDICRGIEMKIPDMPQQHCPRYYAALVANQILQKLEFPRKKKNVLAASAGGPRHQVDGEIADPQDGFLYDGVTASAKRLDARQQFDEGKRLDQIVVAPGTQAAHPIVDLPERTDDQKGCGDAVVAQLTHDRDAIDVRKHAVDRDHGIVAGNATAQRLIAAGGQIHLVAAGRERLHDLTGSFRVVLNDENTAVTSRHGLPSPNGWPKAGFTLASGCATKLAQEGDGRHWPNRSDFAGERSGDDHYDVWILAHEPCRRDGIRHNNQRVKFRSSSSPDQYGSGVTSIAKR